MDDGEQHGNKQSQIDENAKVSTHPKILKYFFVRSKDLEERK